MKKTTVRKILSYAGTVLSVLFLVFAVTVAAVTFTAKAQGRTPSLFGHSFHIVVTGSMEPEIKVGELVVSRKTAVSDVSVGDNIVFLCVDPDSPVYGEEIIHKVARITEEGIFTKGVANADEDKVPVTAANLRGVEVAQSVFFGSVVLFLSNPFNWLFLLLLAVLIYIVVRLTKSIVRQVRAARAEAAGTVETEAEERARLEAEIRAQYGLPPGDGGASRSAEATPDDARGDTTDKKE